MGRPFRKPARRLRQRDSGRRLPARLSPFHDDGRVDAAPDIEARREPQEARVCRCIKMVGDLIRHGLVKGSTVAERPDVQLQRLQLHTQPVGNIFELQGREVRLAGFRAQAGELRDLHPDGVVALGRGIGKSFEISLHATYTTTFSLTRRKTL